MSDIIQQQAAELLLSYRMQSEQLNELALIRCRKIPAFQELEDTKNRVISSLFRQKLSGDTQKLLVLNSDIARIECLQQLIASGNGIILNNFQCKDCNDSGVTSTGDVCGCVRRIYSKLANDVNNSDIISCASLSSKIPTIQHGDILSALYTKVKQWADKFPNVKLKNIVISGGTGVGKSYLISALANYLIAKGVSVVYTSSFHLNQKLLAHHLGKLNDGGTLLNSLIDCDILLIDDLGSEPVYNKVTVEYLQSILDSRSNKSTVITTNFDIRSDTFGKRYGERVYSRLNNQSNTFSFYINGKDMRLYAKL